MSITKRIGVNGDVSWTVRFRDKDGKYYPAATFDRKGDADDHQDALKEIKKKGWDIKLGCKYTLKEYFEKWNVERGIEWGRSYRKDTIARFKNHIAPSLGSKPLTDIDSSDISLLMVELKHKGLAAGTRNAIQNNLNRMFRDAVDFYKVLLSSPVREDHRAKGSKKERSFWKPSECYRFLDSVREHRYGAAYWIMLWNGFRIGEILGLRHGDLDLEAGMFYIKRQYSKNEYVVSELKNKTEYSPKMAPPLQDFLLEKLPKDADPDSLVFTSQTGSFASYKTVSSQLTKAAKSQGLKRLTLHELRHSMTGLWVDIGATEVDLQKLLNHKSTVSTKGYMHQTPDRIEMLAAKLRMPNAKVIPINAMRTATEEKVI